jgi:hypothetical protein
MSVVRILRLTWVDREAQMEQKYAYKIIVGKSDRNRLLA